MVILPPHLAYGSFLLTHCCGLFSISSSTFLFIGFMFVWVSQMGKQKPRG